tara:strand:+ start:609 stop:746 length:138 start_codon:yes stop_codon:yes gene_type:complete
MYREPEETIKYKEFPTPEIMLSEETTPYLKFSNVETSNIDGRKST